MFPQLYAREVVAREDAVLDPMYVSVVKAPSPPAAMSKVHHGFRFLFFKILTTFINP